MENQVPGVDSPYSSKSEQLSSQKLNRHVAGTEKSDAYSLLHSKMKNRTAVVGILGMGYVGIPLALRFSQVGYKVIGFDIDQQRVNTLNKGESYIAHISSDQITSARSQGFEARFDFTSAGEVDAFIICVPTPLTKHREPDLSYVVATLENIRPFLRKGQVISLESTTYPGTTEEEIISRVEKENLKVGTDVFVVFSPEREDPGNPNFHTQTIPKIVGGHTKACLEIGLELYREVVNEVVAVSSTKTAEMVKLLENIHRAVNIGLVNEMKMVADRMGIDIHEVIRAASTKPFGFTPYFPGPGLGGHCIPIDPFYLTWKAKEYGLNTRFIELAGEVNTSMPNWVVSKVVDALNEREKSVKGSRILLLGIAYKKNVDDMRESPSLELLHLLSAKGATVEYSDPWIPMFKDHSSERTLSNVKLTADNIKEYDCVLVATNHDDFDYAMIQKNASLIVDTRGVYLEPALNVVKA